MSVEDVDVQPKSRTELVAELFGDKFKGEVAPVEDPADPPEEIQETQPEADEDLPPVVEADTEPADEVDRSEEDLIVQALQEEEAQEVVPEEVKSIDDVARRLEMESSDLYQLQIPVRDGANVTLGQLKDAYHEVLDASKQYQTRAERLEQLSNAYDAMESEAEKAILGRFEEIDWNALREEDPAAYAAERTDFEAAQRRVAEMKQAGNAQREAAANPEPDEETKQRQQMILAEQARLLVQKIPEVADPKRKAEIEQGLIGQMRAEGFEDAEITQTLSADHRAWVLVNKARLYDELKAKVQNAKKKVEKVPKVLTPGTPPPPQQRDQEKVREARGRLRKSGSVDDAVALLMARNRGKQA